MWKMFTSSLHLKIVSNYVKYTVDVDKKLKLKNTAMV